MSLRNVVLAICALLTGCGLRLTHYHDYRGDGVFSVQRAPSSICQDAYAVDFGAVDLAAAGEATLHVEGLPPMESTIGLGVSMKPVSAGTPAEDPPRPSPLIELTLRDANDHIVLSRHERLSQWVRSWAPADPRHSYFYQRGTQADIPVAPGAVRSERFPIGEDDSWGTYFTPRRGARYTLHFAVEDPDPDAADLDVHLRIQAVAGCL